jgi:hypothetical protein
VGQRARRRRTVHRGVEFLGEAEREVTMDAIFWIVTALIIYFLFFRPAG